jgi:hypothetical protein
MVNSVRYAASGGKPHLEKAIVVGIDESAESYLKRWGTMTKEERLAEEEQALQEAILEFARKEDHEAAFALPTRRSVLLSHALSRLQGHPRMTPAEWAQEPSYGIAFAEVPDGNP